MNVGVGKDNSHKNCWVRKGGGKRREPNGGFLPTAHKLNEKFG
jgi:hypothetical protein